MVRIKNFFILAIICVSVNSCSSIVKEEPLLSVDLIASTPIIKSENGKLINLVDTLKIIYHQNSVLIQIPYFDQLINVITNKAGHITSENLIKDELKYKFFIYKKGSVFGLIYDSLNSKFGEKLLVDSFLAERSFQNMKLFDRFYRNSNDSLLVTLDSSQNGFLTEKYVTKIKYDETYNDTTYLYYSNEFKGIDFSFSKELDSIKKMKLCKIRFIYNSMQTEKFPFPIPKREFLFEIKEVQVANPEKIIRFIERVKTAYEINK